MEKLNTKSNIMYGLNCSYYTKTFSTIGQLVDDILSSGMDPNYEITKDGKPTGEFANDLIVEKMATKVTIEIELECNNNTTVNSLCDKLHSNIQSTVKTTIRRHNFWGNSYKTIVKKFLFNRS